MRRFFGSKIFSLLTLLVCISGCEAEKVKTTKNPVVPDSLQRIPLSDQNLFSNKLFLWRYPTDSEAMKAVILAGNKIDQLEDQGGVARDELKKIDLVLETEKAKFKTKNKDLVNYFDVLWEERIQLQPKEVSDYNVATSLEDAKAANKRLLDAAKTLPDEQRNALSELDSVLRQKSYVQGFVTAATSFEGFEKEIALAVPEYEKQLSEAKQNLVGLDAEAERFEKNLIGLPMSIQMIKVSRDDFYGSISGFVYEQTRAKFITLLQSWMRERLSPDTELEKAYERRLEAARVKEVIGIQIQNEIKVVVQNTDYFEGKPDRVSFNLRPSGDLAVAIEGWPEKGVNHSYGLGDDTGTIFNVSYKELGGEIEFDVETIAGIQYFHFRLSRSRLHLTDGRIYYEGNLDRYVGDVRKGGGTLERRGRAKLSNVAN